MNIILKILGFIFLSAGFILMLRPDLFDEDLLLSDTYAIIEKRVKWGLAIGMGIFFLFHHNWSFSVFTITAFLTALTLGVVTARVAGLILDGFILKQLGWLLLELVALAIFGFLYLKQKA